MNGIWNAPHIISPAELESDNMKEDKNSDSPIMTKHTSKLIVITK